MNAPRGFKYPLEPLRMKGEWDLTDMQMQLAECNRALDGVQAVVRRLTDEVSSQCSDSRAAATVHDTVMAEVQMMRHAYVGLLSQRLRHAELDLGRLEHQRIEITQRTTCQQRFNDGIERHRQLQWRNHLHGQSVRASNEADDAWQRSRHHEARLAANRSDT